MERLYRIVLLGMFILGFIGAVASADKNQIQQEPSQSLIRDVRLAQEVNAVNDGTWNQDVANVNEDGLARVEAILSQQVGEQTAQK